RESDLRQQVAAHLHRGKVDCTLNFRRSAGGSGTLELNRGLVAELAARARALRRDMPELGPLDPMDVLRWPGVVEDPGVDAEAVFGQAATALAGALDALVEMRASEGRRLARLIDARCRDILAITATVRERIPEILA